MAKRPTANDSLEFDPFADAEQPAAGNTEVKLEFDPFGDSSGDEEEVRAEDAALEAEREIAALTGNSPGTASARPGKPKALKLDFNDVLDDDEMAGAQKAGSGTIDNKGFYSKEDLKAMERAKSLPKHELPSSIELEEERASAVRVVAENKLAYLWFALAIAGIILLGIGVVGFVYQRQKVAQEEELQRLLDAAREQSQQQTRELHSATRR